jgi:hypothetical protein
MGRGEELACPDDVGVLGGCLRMLGKKAWAAAGAAVVQAKRIWLVSEATVTLNLKKKIES